MVQPLWKVVCQFLKMLSMQLPCVCVYVSTLSRVQLFETPWTAAHQAPLFMGFSRQESQCRLPFPTPGDLLDPGIELTSLTSPTLPGGFFTTEPPGKIPHYSISQQFQILPLDMYPRKTKAYVHTKSCTQMFISALFITVKTQKQLKGPSTDKHINNKLC